MSDYLCRFCLQSPGSDRSLEVARALDGLLADHTLLPASLGALAARSKSAALDSAREADVWTLKM